MQYAWQYNLLIPLYAVAQPLITNQSLFESKSITLYWEQDNAAAVESYKIQYSYTIRQCANEMNTDSEVTDELNKIQIMARNNYTIRDSTVEEDSDYNISLVAVNSNVSSPADTIMGTTKQAGMHVCTQLCANIRLIFECIIF